MEVQEQKLFPHLTVQPFPWRVFGGQGNPDLTQSSFSDRETEGLSWPHWVPGFLAVNAGPKERTHSREEEAKVEAEAWAKGAAQALPCLALPSPLCLLA